jgi:hypothetical protein
VKEFSIFKEFNIFETHYEFYGTKEEEEEKKKKKKLG